MQGEGGWVGLIWIGSSSLGHEITLLASDMEPTIFAIRS